MIKKLLPVIFLLVGVGGGIGAGIVLKPSPEEMTTHNPCGDVEETQAHEDDADHDAPAAEEDEPEYVELNNQFVVPVVSDDMVDSLVVISIGIELDQGQAETVYKREPKLRDALLQVMFDHANIGGFRGRFTDGNNMDVLRVSLTEAAQAIMGTVVRGVIITDIARQDI